MSCVRRSRLFDMKNEQQCCDRNGNSVSIHRRRPSPRGRALCESHCVRRVNEQDNNSERNVNLHASERTSINCRCEKRKSLAAGGLRCMCAGRPLRRGIRLSRNIFHRNGNKTANGASLFMPFSLRSLRGCFDMWRTERSDASAAYGRSSQ